MTDKPLWNGSELLRKILSDFLSKRIDAALFCDNYEEAFNFQIDISELSPQEIEVFGDLFEQVVLFTPYPEEQDRYPGYLTDPEIFEAATDAQSKLDADA